MVLAPGRINTLPSLERRRSVRTVNHLRTTRTRQDEFARLIEVSQGPPPADSSDASSGADLLTFGPPSAFSPHPRSTAWSTRTCESVSPPPPPAAPGLRRSLSHRPGSFLRRPCDHAWRHHPPDRPPRLVFSRTMVTVRPAQQHRARRVHHPGRLGCAREARAVPRRGNVLSEPRGRAPVADCVLLFTDGYQRTWTSRGLGLFLHRAPGVPGRGPLPRREYQGRHRRLRKRSPPNPWSSGANMQLGGARVQLES